MRCPGRCSTEAKPFTNSERTAFASATAVRSSGTIRKHGLEHVRLHNTWKRCELKVTGHTGVRTHDNHVMLACLKTVQKCANSMPEPDASRAMQLQLGVQCGNAVFESWSRSCALSQYFRTMTVESATTSACCHKRPGVGLAGVHTARMISTLSRAVTAVPCGKTGFDLRRLRGRGGTKAMSRKVTLSSHRLVLLRMRIPGANSRVKLVKVVSAA